MLALSRDTFARPREAVSDAAIAHSLLSLTVDTLRQGLLVFDDRGDVVSINAAARRSIAQRTGLRLRQFPGSPTARQRLDLGYGTHKLERALRDCAATPPQTAEGAPRGTHALVLSMAGGQPDLILQLSPLGPRTPAEDGQMLLGVLIDRALQPNVDPATLRDLFGLTEAESRVAAAYLRADTVKDVAQALGISANTVKTHLAAAYQKTGCTRQAQLVRLLMALAEGESA